MPQAATIKILPRASRMMKAMQAQGIEWGEDYRRASAQALKEVLEGRMAATETPSDDGTGRRPAPIYIALETIAPVRETAMVRFVLAVLLVAALAAPASADFPAAVEAYDQGDYAIAFAETRPVAERGDADAQYMLGFLYARGEGVRRDLVRAYLWFSLAARQGDQIAADMVASLSRRMTPEQIARAKELARDWSAD